MTVTKQSSLVVPCCFLLCILLLNCQTIIYRFLRCWIFAEKFAQAMWFVSRASFIDTSHWTEGVHIFCSLFSFDLNELQNPN